MRTKKMNMTLFLTLSCLSIATLPIVLYMLLALFVFGSGLDAVNKTNLIKAIYFHINEKHKISNEIEMNLSKIYVSDDYSKIPLTLKNVMPRDLEFDNLYREPIKAEDGSVKYVYFFIALKFDNKKYLAYQAVPDVEAEKYIKPQVLRTLLILSLSALLTFISLFLLLRNTIKRTLYPISLLSEWAHSLKYENINEPLPPLIYPELYSVAKFIQRNLSNEYKTIKDEERFWSFCSHELRTPVSVIRVGIDLLTKKVEYNSFDKQQFLSVLNRIKNQSHSMSHIIETILWINRPLTDISQKKIDLGSIIEDIINDFRQIYLIEDANIKIKICHYNINQPVLAVRIVLENLIRNAFQHSLGEEIYIVQHKNVVKIINKVIPNDVELDNTGFGLGYEIITRLVQRLNWKIKIITNDIYNVVSVSFL